MLRGKDVTVLASAPLSEHERIVVENAEVLICVNGSIGQCSRVPDVWVLNSREYDSPIYTNPIRWSDERKRLHEIMMQQGLNRRVRHILFLLKNESPSQTITRLRDNGVTWRGQTVLHAGQKTDLVRSVGVHKFDTAFNTSAGFTAIALALSGKPKHVNVCGFSLASDGYSYLPSVAPDTRLHIAQDTEALQDITHLHNNFSIHLTASSEA